MCNRNSLLSHWYIDFSSYLFHSESFALQRMVDTATVSLQPVESPSVSMSQSFNRTFDTSGTRPVTATSR